MEFHAACCHGSKIFLICRKLLVLVLSALARKSCQGHRAKLQGSCMGPLWFFANANDDSEILQPHCTNKLFADDLK